MIEFPCRCGHRFTLPDDQAGCLIQCPKCRTLCDVPTVDVLPTLNEDGTFRDIPLKVEDDPNRLKEVERTFGAARIDDQGREYDLRPTIEQVKSAGIVAPSSQEQERPAHPKYDPETGQIIDPLAVTPVRPVPAVPVEDQKIHYARKATEEEPAIPAWRVPMQLLMPWNFIVLVILLGMHLMWNASVYIVAAGFLFAAAGLVLLLVALLAHWGNIIDETGPCARNELPSLLRGVHVVDDIWYPFVNLVIAGAICFAPAALAAGDLRRLAWDSPAIALLAIGAFFFPAFLLTTTTAGALRNLRPDRLMGLIRVCGTRYALAGILSIAAVGTYFLSWISLTLHSQSSTFLGWRISGILGLEPVLAYPMLFVGLYLMHLLCWYLGILYRDHHEEFPWVLQRHIPTRSLERAGLLPGAPAAANAQATQSSSSPQEGAPRPPRAVRQPPGISPNDGRRQATRFPRARP